MIYGYARVSSPDQDLTGQIDELKQMGCEKIYSEKFTGTTMRRPRFMTLTRRLKAGDMLVVTKLDRFARTASEGIQLIDKLTAKGVRVNVLNLGLLDNSTAGRLLRNIMLAFAEFERDMIVERLAEGKARARLKPGYKEGRPNRRINKKHRQAYLMLETKTYREVAAITGFSKSTLYRIKNQIEKRK
ncbi:MAG: recombinase family protein [Weissella confusa]|nr:recombinase family protein [Weissella confusa]